MKRILPVVLFILLSVFAADAQILISTKTINLQPSVSAGIQTQIINALDTLLLHVNTGKPAKQEVDSVGSAFTISDYSSLKGIENNEKAKDAHFYKAQLINLYPVGDKYFMSIAYINGTGVENPLRAIVNFVATAINDHVTFTAPLYYLTRNWKIVKMGNTTYHYSDRINLKRAKVFDHKNTMIATKLGLQPESFDFYLCDNYQDILRLQGFEYDSESAGKTEDGYGVDEGVIFSIMHNEDFSHDVFHYYAAKVRTHPRNSAAEEGIAYSWGNPYYTDAQGEMITRQQLITKLSAYLLLHPGADLLDLFTRGPLIFGDQTKVRSLLASLISDEVERRKDIPGIKALIDCGRGDDNYFKVVSELIGINHSNFNIEVIKLVNNYK